MQANGLDANELMARPNPDKRGTFVSPNIEDAEDYARLAAFERGGTPVVMQADNAVIGKYLSTPPNAIAGEMYIPIDQFPNVPLNAFGPAPGYKIPP
jgi:hypothetical protein